MPETLTEKQIIAATNTTKRQLRRLLRLGIISAEPKTLNPIEYHPDTIKIVKSMESENDI